MSGQTDIDIRTNTHMEKQTDKSCPEKLTFSYGQTHIWTNKRTDTQIFANFNIDTYSMMTNVCPGTQQVKMGLDTKWSPKQKTNKTLKKRP